MKRAFISFDFDNDEALRNLLVGQSKNPESPFGVADWSVKEPFPRNWEEKVRNRIRRTDLTIVICGEHTYSASGVATELTITREEQNPYFLLKGYSNRTCEKPRTAFRSDKMYTWTWNNLKLLISGAR